MQISNRSKSVLLAAFAGMSVAGVAGLLMGQGTASQPVKSEPQYFVTADGEDGAHLWVREGATLRAVAHGDCKECKAKAQDGHKEGDGHDHGKAAPKK